MSTILVVDDDQSSRALLQEILSLAGHEVVQAEDGRQALERVEQGSIDLVITDRLMPCMGGLELLQALARRPVVIPAIVVSAFGEEALWGQAIGLGAKEYLLKPFKADDVLALVRKYAAGGPST
jgi:CheY-like chemotaxis protein